MPSYMCMLRPTWMISALQHKSKYNFELFEKNQIFGFPCCSTRKDLSIDVSITIVGLILTKLRWFHLFGTSRNSISNIFGRKIAFPCCRTREDLSIDVSDTNVGLILTKPGWFFFSGYGQTGFWNHPMETGRYTRNFNSSSKLVVSRRLLYAWIIMQEIHMTLRNIYWLYQVYLYSNYYLIYRYIIYQYI